MPAKLDRCVSHLQSQGYSEKSAYAICQSALSLSQKGWKHKLLAAAIRHGKQTVHFFSIGRK